MAGRSAGKSFYPVQDYDGTDIPFPDADFNLVFSSNVLEHGADSPFLRAEVRRTLKPQGRALHLMPSSTWRLWTSLSHHAFAVKVLLRGGKLERDEAGFSCPNTAQSDAAQTMKAKAAKAWMGLQGSRDAGVGAHGEYPNAASELYYFSRGRWAKVFRNNGFVLMRVRGNRLFYTGYRLLQGLTMENRRMVSRVLDASVHAYCVRKK